MKILRISFDTVLPIWENKLWVGRGSAIETHSAMTWPYSWPDNEINMGIFEYPATFWGAYIDNKLVGVNSGHCSAEVEYRSRGIWVDPDYRKHGVSQMLFAMTQHQALIEKCEMIWSIPRKTALPAYTKFGFNTVGDYFGTETADANIYVSKRLI